MRDLNLSLRYAVKYYKNISYCSWINNLKPIDSCVIYGYSFSAPATRALQYTVMSPPVLFQKQQDHCYIFYNHQAIFGHNSEVLSTASSSLSQVALSLRESTRIVFIYSIKRHKSCSPALLTHPLSWLSDSEGSHGVSKLKLSLEGVIFTLGATGDSISDGIIRLLLKIV